ncbi:MAG: hypothetical protein R2932_08420 [Caldilineaceae bacterium]
MPPNDQPTHYQTYLLRLRQTAHHATAQPPTDHSETTDTGIRDPGTTDTEHRYSWQFILVHPYTGARRTFESLDALMAFLHEQIKAGSL